MPTLGTPIKKEWARFKIETKLVRSKKWRKAPNVIVKSPEDVARGFKLLGLSDRERLIAIYLTGSNRIVGAQEVAIGARGFAVVPFDTIIRSAILSNSGGIILIHNHPGGSLQFSTADVDVAKRLKQIGEPLDIAMLDMLIIADGEIKSMKSGGLL